MAEAESAEKELQGLDDKMAAAAKALKGVWGVGVGIVSAEG